MVYFPSGSVYIQNSPINTSALVGNCRRHFTIFTIIWTKILDLNFQSLFEKMINLVANKARNISNNLYYNIDFKLSSTWLK